MMPLVGEATARLGPLDQGRKYCLKIPAILGGEYGGDNLGTISLTETDRRVGRYGQANCRCPGRNIG